MCARHFKTVCNISVGIWNNEEMIARIYSDKIIVENPYIKWINNSGNLGISKNSIRNQKIIDRILIEMKDGCEDKAWDLIERAIME